MKKSLKEEKNRKMFFFFEFRSNRRLLLARMVQLTGSTTSAVASWYFRPLEMLASIDWPRMPICAHIGKVLVHEPFHSNCTVIDTKKKKR